MDVANADGESVAITGTTTITGLGTGFNGCYRELRFAGALTLAHSSNLKLPGNANITTAAGTILGFRCTGSGVWELVSGNRDVGGYMLNIGPTAESARTALALGTAAVGNLDTAGTPFTLVQRTGAGDVFSAECFAGGGATAGIATGSAGTVYLRPNGKASTAG